MKTIDRVTVETLAAGGLMERANECLKDIAGNILDPNRDPEAVRELVITVKITPHKNRENASYSVIAKSKLAPLSALDGVLFISGKNNQCRMFEKNPDQVEMNLKETKKLLNEE